MANDFEHRKCCYQNINKLSLENGQLLHIINKQRENLIDHQYRHNQLAHDITKCLISVVDENKDDDIFIKKQLYLIDEYKKEKEIISSIQDFISKYEHKIRCNLKVISNLKEHLCIYD